MVGWTVHRNWVRQVFAWLLLITVVAVCVSPYVDLDDCALRSRRAASLFFWLLASALFMLVIRMSCAVRIAPVRLAAIQRHATWIPPDSDVFAITQMLRV